MPRATHPITGVLHYFKTAPLDAAEVALHMAKEVVRDRQQTAPVRPVTAKAPAKPRKAKAKVTAPPPPPTPPVAARRAINTNVPGLPVD
jgi:hypothetical protein